ncbi:hypothetical protein J4Q44_G00306160 [Coregonus suidteri]|uniref:Formin GTPase-binding domain-containing protein n=1 Tax=Coregonus suidteri TaxID=861788 RepID=A0AAN8QHW4_9TELE
MDQASGGEDPNKANKKKEKEDESKNKKLRDRITSFRKTGNKKDKPLIQHSTDPLSTQVEMPMPQPLFDDRSMNLSEKEVNDLFEKMMEDMNLNEERKAPLRGKDLSTKREMVVQYISATAKSITGSKIMVIMGLGEHCLRAQWHISPHGSQSNTLHSTTSSTGCSCRLH